MSHPEPPHLHALDRMPAPFQRLPNPLSNHPGEVRTAPVRMRALALRGRCAVCGCALTTAWRQFAADDAGENGVWVSGGVAPTHRSCALFGALTCPWLRTAKSRGRRFGQLRGPMTVRGFARWDYFCPIGDRDRLWLNWAYWDEIEAIDCGDSWRDLDVTLQDEVDVSTRLDMRHLDEYVRADWKLLRDECDHPECVAERRAFHEWQRKRSWGPAGLWLT